MGGNILITGMIQKEEVYMRRSRQGDRIPMQLMTGEMTREQGLRECREIQAFGDQWRAAAKTYYAKHPLREKERWGCNDHKGNTRRTGLENNRNSYIEHRDNY